MKIIKKYKLIKYKSKIIKIKLRSYQLIYLMIIWRIVKKICMKMVIKTKTNIVQKPIIREKQLLQKL